MVQISQMHVIVPIHTCVNMLISRILPHGTVGKANVITVTSSCYIIMLHLHTLATSSNEWCSLISLGRSHRGGAAPPTVTSTPAASLSCISCSASTDGLPARAATCWPSCKGWSFSSNPCLKLSWCPGHSGKYQQSWDSVTHHCWESDRKWYGTWTITSTGFQGLSPNLRQTV